MSDRDVLLLDACSIINLYATRRIMAILASHTPRFCVVDVVRQEAGYVFRGGDGPDASEREPIDLIPLEDAGLLKILVARNEDEFLAYIDLSLEMDDGEAMTGSSRPQTQSTRPSGR